MTTISETCGCGASFYINARLHSEATSAAAVWRDEHQHTDPVQLCSHDYVVQNMEGTVAFCIECDTDLAPAPDEPAPEPDTDPIPDHRWCDGAHDWKLVTSTGPRAYWCDRCGSTMMDGVITLSNTVKNCTHPRYHYLMGKPVCSVCGGDASATAKDPL